MNTLSQAQKELDKAIKEMKKTKQENTAKNDFPELKRTFTYKKDGSL